MFVIRKTKMDDVSAIDEIFDIAKLSLKNNGVDQWQKGSPNKKMAIEDVKNEISYVAEIDGRVMATAVLYVGIEETYAEIRNGKWLTNSENYGIIHRIAVHSDAKKNGVASKMIEKAVEIAQKEGATSVRCDTHKDNKIMQRTLAKNNFVYCGEITIADGSERIAFELVF